MNKDILVSIILPVFNCEATIADAINSILVQTHENFEILICDDGSTDSSYDLIKKTQSTNKKKIKLFKNHQNQGMSSTLNKLINISKGEYIMRMDGDDIIEPIKVECQVSFLEKNKTIDVVGTAYKKITTSGKHIFTSSAKETHSEIINLINIKKFFLSGPNLEITDGTIMARSKWFKSNLYNPLIFYSQDFELMYRTSHHSIFANINIPLYYYRASSGVTYSMKAQLQSIKTKYLTIQNSKRKISFNKKIVLYTSLCLRPIFYLFILTFHKLRS